MDTIQTILIVNKREKYSKAKNVFIVMPRHPNSLYFTTNHYYIYIVFLIFRYHSFSFGPHIIIVLWLCSYLGMAKDIGTVYCRAPNAATVLIIIS